MTSLTRSCSVRPDRSDISTEHVRISEMWLFLCHFMLFYVMVIMWLNAVQCGSMWFALFGSWLCRFANWTEVQKEAPLDLLRLHRSKSGSFGSGSNPASPGRHS